MVAIGALMSLWYGTRIFSPSLWGVLAARDPHPAHWLRIGAVSAALAATFFLFRLDFSPVKILLFVARILGYNRLFLFGLGVFVGLCVAPRTGQQFRERLRQLIEGDRPVAPPL